MSPVMRNHSCPKRVIISTGRKYESDVQALLNLSDGSQRSTSYASSYTPDGKAHRMEIEMKNSCHIWFGRLSNAASRGNHLVNDACLRLHFGIRGFIVREEAQDVVEYALVVALVAFGAATGMKALSTEIKNAFSTISSDLASSL
jgi:pilus assembly protein Flp/PilA